MKNMKKLIKTKYTVNEVELSPEERGFNAAYNTYHDSMGKMYSAISKQNKSTIREFRKAWDTLEGVIDKFFVDESMSESVELVHVRKDGKIIGTGELKKTKGNKSLVSFDAEHEEWFDSNDVEVVEALANITESLIEGRRIQTKRRYTENHPSQFVGKTAKIRNKILEAIKDGKITQDEFDTIVKELSADHNRWMKRNGKLFNVSEDGITLSKFGLRILAELDETPKTAEVFEATVEMDAINPDEFKVGDKIKTTFENFVNEKMSNAALLKKNQLSPEEYQLVKKLKDFNVNDYEWSEKEGLYDKK